ncbi:PREDICTED: uncharacterized protein LOC108660657 [Theobroma cacao]|uniref:Uncharacterized protein LOC108660657 n=1 Tax=Theobroma cacao TaxID=3641 RepID=A0AB32VRF4_THECC|nr:PREDICTED: uncharacterized protein LOC108660657 [Theobroma cacao]
MIVRAFDGTRREVVGNIEIPIEIGPCTFTIEFQVMDIATSYNYLLERPWIHMDGAIPLSLHQKVKFIVDGKIVYVNGEEDLLVSKPADTLYVEATEEVPECSFRSFEFVNTTYIGERIAPPTPKLSQITQMAVSQIVGKGYRAGAGLGRELQGIRRPIRATKTEERFSLRYKPTKKERGEMIAERRRERLAHFKGHELENHGMTYPHLYETFQSGGCIFPESLAVGSRESVSVLGEAISDLSICATEEGKEQPKNMDGIPTTYLGPRKLKLSSWTTMSLLVTCDSISKIPNNECEDDNDSGFEVNFEKDMPGLNTNIVAHKLPLKPECKPIKQKLRRMKPEMLLKIKEEVKKQLDARFLEVAKYLEWVANIVPIPKKDGKVRMCVDYRDLNRAILKDNFPLPHINTIVDNTARHSMFSFMDGFSREVEVYVDDMIVKAHKTEDHAINLERLFKRLRKFQLRLNPIKCTFGVTSGKLLDFVISEKGIEVDPDKVQAIRDLPPPKMQKEVRGFLGRLNYIVRFISQLTLKCDPIFKLFRKHNLGAWNEECQVAFDKVKEYLLSPPVLVPFVVGRTLILYLTVNERSMGCVLGQHDETGKKERAVYYLSKKFIEYESKYSSLKKMCCALAWTAYRLRQYMLYHTTWLIAKLDPIKYIFEKPSLSGRVARWQVLLSEYDIVYVSQKSIKGSAIVDFLAERVEEDYEPMKFEFLDEDLMSICQTNEEESEEKENWKMFFDGASNALGHGIRVVLVSPEGNHYPVIAKLNFYCTNNVAEYEACVMGLQAAIERKIHVLEVYGDFALVIYQLQGEWETRDSKLVRYHKYVSKLIENFDKIRFTHFLREENQMANALATLTTMFKVGTDVKIQPIMINLRECLAHCSSVEEEVDRKPWYHDIVHYLKFQQYLEQSLENDKKTIRRLAMNFFLDGDILYKRSRDQVLLRCVDSAEARRIVEEVHEGICGAHASGHMLARQKVVCKFIQKEIICRYGLPERIITNNASNLNGSMMKEVCAKFKIKHHNSMPYRPKMNGAVEAVNKNIKRIIEKMIDVYKDWHEKLPFALHAYRTTVRTSTGATPFFLVYGMEAVLPIEVEIPSLRVLKEVQLEEAKWVNARYEQLNLIEEKRLAALCHGQLYQKRMMRAYGKKAHLRKFQK